jgi:hypothetical protein
MLYSALLTILSTTAYAEPTNSTPAAPTIAPQSVPTKGNIIPIINDPNKVPTSPATPPQIPSTQAINCGYSIPATTTHIEQSIVMKWAESATQQSFNFNHATIDEQLKSLKSCYTEQGWQSFTDALQKSGNRKTIENQKLTVTSIIKGKTIVTDAKDNQWKVSLPIEVTYKNDKETMSQVLNIDLIVGRKTSGDLGIMQMIASPNQNTSAATVKP